MQILAIDYGRSKVGLAIAAGPLAEPYKVIRYKKVQELFKQLLQIIQQEDIHKVVLGISEGEMAKEIKRFGDRLATNIDIPLIYQDETLSTQDALSKSIRSGMNRKKRKQMEDAFAACIVLQDYLDKISD